MDLELAFVFDDRQPLGVWNSRAYRPWHLLPRWAGQATKQTTLAELIDAGAAELGFHPRYARTVHEEVRFIGLSTGDYDAPHEYSSVNLVDEDGLARFGVRDWTRVTASGLRRAADAGILHGDVSRVYIFDKQTAGATDLTTWAQAFDYLRPVLDVLGVASTCEWAGAKTLTVLDRLTRGERALHELGPALLRQGSGGPYQLMEMLRSRDWTEAQLAPLLGTSPRTAAQVLEASGWARDPQDGVFRERGDESAAFISEVWEALPPGDLCEDRRTDEGVRAAVEAFEDGTAPHALGSLLRPASVTHDASWDDPNLGPWAEGDFIEREEAITVTHSLDGLTLGALAAIGAGLVVLTAVARRIT